MANITKNFIQVDRAMDCECRRYAWCDTDKTYEEAVEGLDVYTDGVREVEKTFNPDTFEITVKVIRETDYKYNWDKGEYEVVEKV